MKNRFFGFILAVILLVALSACGGQSAGDVIGNVGAAGAVVLQEASGYYTEGVNLENDITAKFAAFQVTYNAGLNAVRDQNVLADQCFTNVADVVQGALAGVFDKSSASNATLTPDEQPTGILNQDAFISALSLNETYPDTSLCQQAKTDIMRTVLNWRQSTLDDSKLIFDRMRTYRNFLNDSVKKRVLKDLINKHSDSFEGIGIDSSFIGFPTDQLSVVLRTKDICDIYNEDHSGDPMYVAKWNRALTTCTLSRLAAMEFIERPFISSEASNRIDQGQDAGAFDTVPTAVSNQ